MAKLSIGNYKKNLGVTDNNEEDNVQRMQPIEDTSTEIAEQVVDTPPVVTEQVEATESVEQVVNEEAAPTNTAETVENTPTQKQDIEQEQVAQENNIVESKPLELTDDVVKSYLSEKLGKDIDLSDLTKEQVNPLDSDPLLKDIYEWRKDTGRSVEDFFKYQKDYSKVSDIDVAREFLQLKYPNSTNEEINLELSRYKTTDVDLDEEVAHKNWELKKLATEGRAELDKLKATLSEPAITNLPSEVQEKVSYAEQIQKQIEANNTAQQEYERNLTNAALSTESLKLQVGDITLDYFVSEDKRKTLPQDISDMPHWKNKDGSWNHKAVVEDGIKIKYFDEIIKLVQEQSLNTGKEDIIKQAANVTIDKVQSPPSTDTGNRGFIIEDGASSNKRKLTMKSYKR